MVKVKNKIYNNIYNLLNSWYFRRYGVEYEPGFMIRGRIFIDNKGTIKIGNAFKANSGSKFNPIGGDTILRLICRPGATISIGDHCGISNSTFVARERIDIGNHVMIGGGCRLWDNDFHSIDPEIRTSGADNDIAAKRIRIHDYAFIGGGSIILKGVEIGKNSIVAAGSVVTKSIPENEIWGGNPARFIKKVSG